MKKLFLILLIFSSASAYSQFFIGGEPAVKQNIEPYLVLEARTSLNGVAFQLAKNRLVNKQFISEENGDVKTFNSHSDLFNFLHRLGYKLVETGLDQNGFIRVIIFEKHDMTPLDK